MKIIQVGKDKDKDYPSHQWPNAGLTLLQYHWHCCSVTDTVAVSLTLLQYHWHCCSVTDTVAVSLTLLQYHRHCCSVTDTVAVSMTLLQCHWHCCSVTDTVAASLTLLQCHWHCCSITDTVAWWRSRRIREMQTVNTIMTTSNSCEKLHHILVAIIAYVTKCHDY